MDEEDIEQQKLFILFHIQRNKAFSRDSELRNFNTFMYSKMGIQFDIPEKSSKNLKLLDGHMKRKQSPSWIQPGSDYAQMFHRVTDVYYVQNSELAARFQEYLDPVAACDSFLHYRPPLNIQEEIDRVLVSYLKKKEEAEANLPYSDERRLRGRISVKGEHNSVILDNVLEREPVQKVQRKRVRQPVTNQAKKDGSMLATCSYDPAPSSSPPTTKKNCCECVRSYSVDVLHDQVEEQGKVMKRLEEHLVESIRLFKAFDRSETAVQNPTSLLDPVFLKRACLELTTVFAPGESHRRKLHNKMTWAVWQALKELKIAAPSPKKLTVERNQLALPIFKKYGWTVPEIRNKPINIECWKMFFEMFDEKFGTYDETMFKVYCDKLEENNRENMGRNGRDEEKCDSDGSLDLEMF